MPDAPVTYVVTIDALDETRAAFRSLPHTVTEMAFEFRRKEWEDLGRPAEIFLTVTATAPWTADG